MATDAQLRQIAEELDGSRQLGNKGRAAVRLDDLNGLLALPEDMKSVKAAGATPTQAEFDALYEDVRAMWLRQQAVIQALRSRRGR